MKYIKHIPFLFVLFFLAGCNGHSRSQSVPMNDPYFITTEPVMVKKIMVPAGTKLVYEEGFFLKGEQNHIMNEKRLTRIKLKSGVTIDWGGVPVTEIEIFFNHQMTGFSVYPNFRKLSKSKRTRFSELWESCRDDLDVDVKNINDWSFNPENISGIEGCSINYQRYFKKNTAQQRFLNETYNELKKIDSK